MATVLRIDPATRNGRYHSRRLDPAVLEAFRQRDASSVRLVYREYGHLVYAVARHVLGRHELAEEATQQTFVRAWEAAERIDSDRDPAPWLATIAKRVAIDIHRREARRPAVPTADIVSIADHSQPLMMQIPDEQSVDAVWQVRNAIDELPAEEAFVVRLHHLHGLSHAEIAEQLGIPLGTVKSRSHRAHRRLSDLLGNLRRNRND